jgi:penicillin-binding protein 1A
MTTVRSAITHSTNVVALKCFQQVGMDEVWAYLQNFGLEHLTSADQVESLALGGTNGGVTNLEMTAAYSAIANGGTYIEPHYYTQVLDREGQVLLTKVPEQRVVLQSATASLLTSAMEDVLSSGTGTAASFSGMELAGKSGTTTDLRDLWFVGYSPYYACGVWGGYDDNSTQSSSTYVKNIWKAVMKRTHADLSWASFSGAGLTTSTICTKCGNLAVDGLCDNTVQGDMTYTEKFASDTVPTESCTCHTAVEICSSSGQRASIYCPETETKVYLGSGTAGTADADYVLPTELEEDTCSVHQHWWNWFLPGDGDASTAEDPGQEDPRQNTPERNDNWWNWFNNWGW